MKKLFFVLVLVLMVIPVSAKGLVNANDAGVLIDGYDVVAYFLEGKAVQGKSIYQTQTEGVTLFFASEHNLTLFLANPATYLPQFAGHCANGLSDGHLVKANPEIFRIIDGKLYLFFSWWGKAQWKFEQQEQIELANQNWQKFNK